jgi:hypothetical protein
MGEDQGRRLFERSERQGPRVKSGYFYFHVSPYGIEAVNLDRERFFYA